MTDDQKFLLTIIAAAVGGIAALPFLWIGLFWWFNFIFEWSGIFK